jgi:hypothetical protein
MELTFKFNKEEAFMIATALESETELLLRNGEDEKSYKVSKLKERFFELYNMGVFNDDTFANI